MSRPIAFLLLIISISAYFIGITSPIATIQTETLLSLNTQQYSVLTSIRELYTTGEVGLAVLIAVFSILFPLAKYLSLSVALFAGGAPGSSGTFRFFKSLGKWSMLDVFVVALLIVMTRINGQDNWFLDVRMETEPGLFVYAFSVVSAMILASRIGMMDSNTVEPVELPNGRIVRPCGFWIRLWATVIDTAISVAIVLPIMFKIYGRGYLDSEKMIQGSADLIFNWVLPVILTVAFWARWQATPGKMMVGAKIVDARTGRPVPLGRLFGRYLGYYLSILPLGIGILWVALDSRRQGWHDKVARTLVIESE